jgi:hypothetical protein
VDLWKLNKELKQNKKPYTHIQTQSFVLESNEFQNREIPVGWGFQRRPVPNERWKTL